MLNLYYEYLAEEAMSDAAEAALEAEAAQLAWEDETCKALAHAAETKQWDLYSDLFKEMHGFRPRGDAWHWYD